MRGQKVVTLAFVFIIGISFVTPGGPFAQFIADKKVEESLVTSLTDHKASLANVSGEIRILRRGSEDWVKVNEDDLLEEGDQIKTSAESTVDIIYDDSSLNVAHIQENTLAEFRKIEPTTIHLLDGNIFNSLKSLPEGQNYEIATETAVSGVRGTEFMRSYSADQKEDEITVTEGSVESFPVLLDGTLSDKSVIIEKDRALKMTPGMFASGKIEDIKPERISKETQAQLAEFSRGIDEQLEQRFGGPEMLKEKREYAKATIKKPEIIEKINQIRKKEEKTRPAGIFESETSTSKKSSIPPGTKPKSN